MKEIKGDIWDYYAKGCWIVITTNGTVKKNGEAVMGRGVALEAKQKFPGIAADLGIPLSRIGNHVFWLEDRIFSFPVKHEWYQKADIKLIERSCLELENLTTDKKVEKIYMVRPGCGNGGLDWKDVKPILEKYLDDRFIIVEKC